MTSDSHHSDATKSSAYLVAPRRGRHRGWFHRRRSSRRGRFELAIIAGGGIALILAALLPGAPFGRIVVMLTVSGLAMTVVARLVGLVPSLVAALFAPLVIGLTDPMWTLGTTMADFTLAEESEAAFATFLAAAIIGSAMRHLHLRVRSQPARTLWSATPPSATPPETPSAISER